MMHLIFLPVDLFRHYLTQLWVHLSVVQTESNQPSGTIKRTYLTTLFIYSLTVLHGIFGLHLEAGRPLTVGSLRISPFLFWRQTFIRQIWQQMDIVWGVSIGCMATILLDFTFKAPINWQFKYTISDGAVVKLGGKAIPNYESTKLLAIIHQAQIISKFFGIFLYILVLLYCYGMVLFVTKVYSLSICSFTFWLFSYPFIYLIVTFCIFLNLTHIIVCGSCIQIRQQHLCSHFTRLLSKLTPKRQFERSIWHQYLALNRSVHSICQQLHAFNTFWSNYLSIIFAEYILLQVLLSYLVFFGPSGQTAMIIIKCIFTVAIIETIVLLFGLIQYCARVVVGNGRISKLNRRFAVHCLRHQTRYQLRIGQLLKIETLQWPRLLHFYAFKLFGNSRITSKTFYAMAINTSGFYFFVLKRMQ